MRLSISHTTRYQFPEPVSFGLQQLRKTPKTSHQQKVLDWTTEVTGGQKELSFQDHHNNVVELLSIAPDTRELTITSSGTLDITESHGILGPHPGPAPLWLYLRGTAQTKPGQGVASLVREVEAEGDLDQLHALSAVIRDAVTYQLEASEPNWSAEDAITAGKGVCQDHTHIFLAAARRMGYPARYVSGYLMLNDSIRQEAMHAWAETHVDGLGWVGFDISNGISPDTRYVRVATGLDYADAAPVTGTRIGGSGESLSVEIEVAQQ
ncbi:transglutaminase family protein [Roseovarius sp.]|uniref:transglutaminase family protein n=1 Tax=Roseovarius sp. TaxID=1486281 RepID=UPI003BABEDA3